MRIGHIFFLDMALRLKSPFILSYFLYKKTKQNKSFIGFSLWAKISGRHTERKEKGTSPYRVAVVFSIIDRYPAFFTVPLTRHYCAHYKEVEMGFQSDSITDELGFQPGLCNSK